MFEAGALAKNLDRSKVCPLLFGEMEPTDVKGPLVQFQAAKFSNEEMKRVMKAINAELGDATLVPDVLNDVFEMWWPRLEEKVAIQINTTEHVFGQARRNERDLLEEVLSLTRSLVLNRSRTPFDASRPAFREMILSTARLAKIVFAKPPDTETYTAAHRCVMTLRYVFQRAWGEAPLGMRDKAAVFEIEELLKAFALDDEGTSPPPPPSPIPPVPGSRPLDK